jgi:hypothetical protein
MTEGSYLLGRSLQDVVTSNASLPWERMYEKSEKDEGWILLDEIPMAYWYGWISSVCVYETVHLSISMGTCLLWVEHS